MDDIIKALDDRTPVVIGGDMNEPEGPMFNDLAEAGFVNAFADDGRTQVAVLWKAARRSVF